MSSEGDRRRARLAAAHIYLCTPDRPDLEDFVRAVCDAGVDIVQLRDKELDARPLLARAEVARDAAHTHGALFVLNDRPDLALACGADGVHVGQDDAPPALCRAVVGDDVLVGLSTHRPADLAAAADESVDYVSVGPIVATPTKPGREGTGLDYVRLAAKEYDGPFFVTGGVNPTTIGGVLEAGATRVVVVRALTEAGRPDQAAAVTRRLRELIP